MTMHLSKYSDYLTSTEVFLHSNKFHQDIFVELECLYILYAIQSTQ